MRLGAGWSLIGLFFALQEWFTDPPHEPPYTWRRQLSSEMGFWYAWAALIPAIWRLARFFPMSIGMRARLLIPTTAIIRQTTMMK